MAPASSQRRPTARARRRRSCAKPVAVAGDRPRESESLFSPAVRRGGEDSLAFWVARPGGGSGMQRPTRHGILRHILAGPVAAGDGHARDTRAAVFCPGGECRFRRHTSKCQETSHIEVPRREGGGGHAWLFYSIPFYSIPFHSIPFNSILFHSISIHFNPFHSNPFH